MILSGSSTNNIQLWDISNSYNQNLYTYEGHLLWVNCLVKCSPKYFASCSNDHEIRIWDYYNKRSISVLRGHDDCVLGLSLLKDGRLCSGGSDSTIKIWNWELNSCDMTLTGHSKWVKCVCEVNNGNIIAGSDDTTIKVWQTHSNNAIKTLNGHKKSVRVLCQLDDGNFASGSFDKTIKIWNADSFECIDTINAHEKNIISIINIRGGFISCSNDMTIKVWKKYGEFSFDMIDENPYRLCSSDIGTPFEKCDEIAQEKGFLLSDTERISAACVYVMEHNILNGHTCLPIEKLIKVTADFTATTYSDAERAIEKLTENQDVICEYVGDRQYIYLPYLYQAEKYVANRVNLMLMLDAETEKDYSKEIKKLEDEIGIVFAENQKLAINEALSNKLFILTGGPGTGKTTTINAIIRLMEEQGLNVSIAAPTGRAAQRMSELTGKESKTIHRLLEVDPTSKDLLRFRHDEKNPLKADVIIIDEMSMVDITLMESLLRGIRMSAKLILVGDYDQLPSVGAGTVLKDMIECKKIKTVHLNEVFRQAAQSLIVTNAHKIVKGSMPEITVRDNDFFFMQRNNNSTIAQTVIDLCTTRLPRTYNYSPLWDIQIICPTRIGEVGTQRLNVLMQQQINPPSPEKTEINVNGVIFRLGDKIMQTKNNYDIVWMDKENAEGAGIYNGDIGIISQIDKANKTVVVAFSDKTAAYDLDEMTEVEHAYAITVHKSQGSEFEAVILPIMPYKSKMYYRNVLYTAVTRGKSLLIIVGNHQTLSYMVSENKKTVRYTNLLSFIKDYNDSQSQTNLLL